MKSADIFVAHIARSPNVGKSENMRKAIENGDIQSSVAVRGRFKYLLNSSHNWRHRYVHKLKSSIFMGFQEI